MFFCLTLNTWAHLATPYDCAYRQEASLPERKTFAAALLTVSLPFQTLACGSSMNSNRVPESRTIIPATADAQDFPNGQVQFTATGNFSKPPSPAQVTFMFPYSGQRSFMDAGSANIATISSSGLAQCISGASGTATIAATASAHSGAGTHTTSLPPTRTATLTYPS